MCGCVRSWHMEAFISKHGLCEAFPDPTGCAVMDPTGCALWVGCFLATVSISIKSSPKVAACEVEWLGDRLCDTEAALR